MKPFYLIATPIGNLEDITYRAVRMMSEVDVILCEDTRLTKRLLNYYKIETATESYNAHSTVSKEDSIIRRVGEGIVFGMVSDAGTPTISDPGVKLISRLYRDVSDVDIISLPGPSALITALSATGFTGNQFTFYGFLPHKKGRNKIFEEIFDSTRIAIFYESPHRLIKTLEFLQEQYKDSHRKMCVARELTKIYEQKVIGSAEYLYRYFQDHPEKVRGECVILIDKK